MHTPIVRVLLALAAIAIAHAHFVFAVPGDGGGSLRVVLSETLQPDIGVALINTLSLHLHAAEGPATALTLDRGNPKALTAALPGTGTRVVYGVAGMGVMTRGQGKPHQLIYYPKAILGYPFTAEARLPHDAQQTLPVELVPTGKPGAMRLRLLVHGAPRPDGEVTVIFPNGEEKRYKTGPQGETEALAPAGRYAAWARFWETTPGEHAGKHYDERRHYATLVVDAPPAPFALLPQPTSSFGAVADDGWLYVYGGHLSPMHTYFKQAVSGRFHRLRLTGAPVWEELPPGPALQGLNLAAHNGAILRVGGMEPRNEKGQPTDNHSVASAARYRPATGQWEPLPSLPEPRSSHDVVVIGGKLLVTGGWHMSGNAGEKWMESVAILDLESPSPRWQSVPQPFRRRALMAAAFQGKMYVIGGITDRNEVVRTVSIFDPATGQWSDGPALPEGTQLGFAPAAGVHGGALYVSVSNGSLWRLSAAGTQWEQSAATLPRLAHRLASRGEEVLLIGGSVKGQMSAVIEAVRP